MKKLMILFALFILTFFICDVIPQPSNAADSKAGVNKPVISKPGTVKKPRPSKSIKAKLPELVVSRLSLDSQCKITGFLQNKGAKLSHADLLKVAIKISYTVNGKTKQVLLKTQQVSKSTQPILLGGTTDRRNFILGKSAKFTTNLTVPGTKKGFAIIRAEIDPENKIRETPSGERKKSVQSRVRSRCLSNAPKTTMKIDPKSKQKINIPSSSSLANITTRSNEPPYITIDRVHVALLSETIIIRMKNTGGEEIDPMSYTATGLLLEIRDKNSWRWSFRQVDPDFTMQSGVVFNTGKTLSIGDIITIRFSVIAGDRFVGRYMGAGEIRAIPSLAREDSPSHGEVNTGFLQQMFGEIDTVFNDIEGTKLDTGKPIIIRGNGFGPQSSFVIVTFQGEPNGSTPFTLPVQSWTPDEIVAIIPDSFQDMVGIAAGQGLRPRPATLKVLVHGQTIGPQKAIAIYPDYSLYNPVITEHPTRIAPGQFYEIRGDYLLMNGGDYELQVRIIDGARDRSCRLGPRLGRGLITFQAPEDFYMPDRQVEVEIMNTLGKLLRFNATFVPQRYKVISESYHKSNREPSLLGTCAPCCKNYVDRERTTNAFQGKRLINSWMVVNDPSVTVTYCRCAAKNNINLPSRLCRANIISAPAIRSNNPETRVKVWFKPKSVSYTVYVTIVGPSGTPHFR